MKNLEKEEHITPTELFVSLGMGMLFGRLSTTFSAPFIFGMVVVMIMITNFRVLRIYKKLLTLQSKGDGI